MNKASLIQAIVERLQEELDVYFKAAQASRAEATDEQCKAENKYDTRGLEASYLARGQSRQAAEIEAAIDAFASLPPRGFAPGEPVSLGAFVVLESEGERDAYFLGPRAGGTEVTWEQREVTVITPQSPLGERLEGMKEGDTVTMVSGNVKRHFRVIQVL